MALSNFKKTGLACRQAGFTLVELLVSIAIIATLTAILLPNFMGARERAKDASNKQNLLSIKNALRLYYNDNQKYPNNVVAGRFEENGLSTPLLTYFPAVNDIGMTYGYQQTSSGDGFWLRMKTEVTNDQQEIENGASQLKCGLGVGQTEVSYFVVCAN